MPQARCANRFATGKAAAVGIDRQLAADLGPAIGEPFFLFAILAKAVLGHVHDFGAAFSVLQLRDIDILGADPCAFERRLGGERRAVRAPRRRRSGNLRPLPLRRQQQRFGERYGRCRDAPCRGRSSGRARLSAL